MERYFLVILPHPDTDKVYWDQTHRRFKTLMEAYDYVSFSDFYGRPWKVVDKKNNKELTAQEVVKICAQMRSK